ncbi:MAG: isoleucine--tRNA ligase [Microgenomates group bacterium]
MPNKKTSQLPKSPDFPQMETEVQAFWKDTNAFEKSVTGRPEDKPYVFYDGPPFATGLPHYGHLLGSTSKDVIPRYWTMKGYRVERVWGWDCHGLPIENMIEQQLGIKGGKKGIEALGIAKFNDACRTEVLRLDSEWEKIIDRMGRWVDFKNNYKTMDTNFMESVWWGFKTLHQKKLVYEGRKVILYCSRCSTPLSNFEIAMDNSYKEFTEPSTYYKYEIKGQEKTYLLAWSTTPWNKLVTPALAVHPDLTYVKVKQGSEYYYLAESTLKVLGDQPYTVEQSLKGTNLTKLEFELHFDFFPNRTASERVGVVIADEFVTAEEGTGVVTLAVYGEDDYRVMQREGIQLAEHVDDEGKLKPEVTPWAGMYILKVNPLVDEDLASRNLIYKHEDHTHTVPTCYRCSTRLYHAPVPAWFVDVQNLKSKLLSENQKMNWYPEHLKNGRFKHGIENAPDWNISRSRYWGTPMPVWRNTETGTERVIGSIAELKEWAVNSPDVANLTDIHREHVDSIAVWVDDAKTVQGMRIPEVFDCWVESGSMPFAALHYPFENKETFEKSYPAQFVSEYIAQTRAWFYTMHVMSVALFDKHAVENTLTTGTILAKDGNKMSKSKKNYPDPMEVINKYGADSLRLYLMSSTVMKAENLNFNEQEVADIRKRVFMIWYNLVAFYKMYAPDFELDPATSLDPTHVMDKWVVSRMQTTIKTVTEQMDSYDVVRASRVLMDLVPEISTWYLRLSRERLRDAAEKGDTAAWQIFGTVLVQTAQLFAPFAPFFSEWVQHQLVDNSQSIHHSDWPKVVSEIHHPELEEKMEVVRKVVEKTHAARTESQLKLRQPLQTLTVTAPGDAPHENLIEVLKQEVNVKEVIWKVADEITIFLDTKLTESLKQEGEARELIRSIQRLRKNSGLKMGEKATVSAERWPESWKSEIESKTDTTLTKGDTLALL